MPLEARTRITLFLPAPTTEYQIDRVAQTLSAFVQLAGGVAGASWDDPLLDGLWFDPGARRAVRRVILTADVLAPPTAPFLLAYLDGLERACERAFGQEVWVTIHEVQRIRKGDP